MPVSAPLYLLSALPTRPSRCACRAIGGTGNLDPKTASHVFAALDAIVRATGLAALIATHNMELASRMDRRVTLHEGLVMELA